MWRVCKDANRPWPILCPDDDVLDYMVMEAVALKARKETNDAEKAARLKQEVEAERQRLKKLV